MKSVPKHYVFMEFLNATFLLKIPVFCLLLLSSCMVNESSRLLTKSDAEHQNSLEKAKQWFTIHQSYPPIGDLSGSEILLHKDPIWNNYIVHKQNNGKDIIEVPLKIGQAKENLIFQEEKTDLANQNFVFRLLLFEKKENDYAIYIMKINSDNQSIQIQSVPLSKINYKIIPHDFNGNFTFFNWDQTPEGGWRIEQGERVGSQSLRKNSRKSGA